MATPQESGRRILDMYKKDGVGAGGMIMFQTLRARFAGGVWRLPDFATGLQWCVQKGYLEEREPARYFLTDAGFAAL